MVVIKKDKVLKLNIGSGPSGIKGWLNYDWGMLPFLSKLKILRHGLVYMGILPKSYDISWPPIKLVDIRKKFPLQNSIVQFIYCSHVLEHFERWETLRILKECKRVLKKGGCIRVVVPDIEKICKMYQESLSDKSRNPFISRPGRELCRAWWGYEKDINPKNIIQYLSRKFIRGHAWNYDKYELELLLKEAGFEEIKLVSFQEGAMPDIKKLDLESHKDHSLYVEAIRKN